MPERIAATVVTGFLGAGKTSLIRHLAENANGKRLAFLINEFGDLGVDGELLTGCGIEGCSDDEVIELANGCICCTVADDFLPAMQQLLARDPKPDHILIETSGLALPKPLVQAFAWPEVRSNLTVDGVLVVADAAAIAAGLFAADPERVQRAREADEAIDHETPLEELFEEQLACADLVIVNKADLVSPEERAVVEAAILKETRPGVTLLWTTGGALDPTRALGLNMAAEDDLDSRHSHHDGGEPHDHDDFRSVVIAVPTVADPRGFAEALAVTMIEHKLLRAKGFLRVEGKPMRLAVQAVGPRVSHYFDKQWTDADAVAGSLVLIAETEALADVAAVERTLGAALRAAVLCP